MLTRSRAAALGLVVCLFAAHPARAAIELEPGMWQDTETGEENGKPAKPEVTSNCMTPEEAKELAVRAVKFKKERGRLPSISSLDAWEKRMAEGAATFVRFKDEGRYE